RRGGRGRGGRGGRGWGRGRGGRRGRRRAAGAVAGATVELAAGRRGPGARVRHVEAEAGRRAGRHVAVPGVVHGHVLAADRGASVPRRAERLPGRQVELDLPGGERGRTAVVDRELALVTGAPVRGFAERRGDTGRPLGTLGRRDHDSEDQ